MPSALSNHPLGLPCMKTQSSSGACVCHVRTRRLVASYSAVAVAKMRLLIALFACRLDCTQKLARLGLQLARL